jgi:tRNA nucleotidyltransferase/poly(A) polymerase
MKLQPPTTVLEIAADLERAGYEAWCVGGAIRDALLGHPHLDWDLATSATPAQVRQVFGHRRTIPVGVEFGTVGVLDRIGKMHEVTTFRRDVKTDGRHAEVEFGVSLEDDLARRDFTINAIAYSPKLDEIRDPFGGRADLVNKLVRAVGDPDARMREDRLRALRAIRFAARFRFAIDPATLRAIEASAPFLGRLSHERVKQELDKIMEQVRCPSLALETWRATGAFLSLIPVLDGCPVTSFEMPDHLAMPGLRGRPARRAIRFAGLMIALTPAQATTVLTDLRASRAEIQLVSALLDRWNAVGALMTLGITGANPPTDAEVRTWVARIGRLYVSPLMRLAAGVWATARVRDVTAPEPAAVRALHRRMLTIAFRDPIDLGSLAIDGDDLRRAGIPPGPGLGRILQTLLAAVVADPARNTPDWLLQEARRVNAELPVETGPGGGGPRSDVSTNRR